MSIRTRFCPVCGKESDGGIHEECIDWSDEKKLKLQRCRNCGTVWHRNKVVNPEDFDEERIEFKILIKCKKCENEKPYVAQVQLRGGLEPDMRGWDEWVKEVIPLKEGWDVKFSDRNRAFSYVKKILKQNSKIRFTKTTKLVTQTKDGKKIFRPTFLLRLVDEDNKK